jgi:hypothetical protein
MKHSLLEVITGWSFVVFVDLFVFFIFTKIARNSVSKKDNANLTEKNKL